MPVSWKTEIPQAAGYTSVFASSLFYSCREDNPLTKDLLLQIERDYVSSPEMPTAELTGPMALTRHLNACPHYVAQRPDC